MVRASDTDVLVILIGALGQQRREVRSMANIIMDCGKSVFGKDCGKKRRESRWRQTRDADNDEGAGKTQRVDIVDTSAKLCLTSL